jgi:hypothetical protein
MLAAGYSVAPELTLVTIAALLFAFLLSRSQLHRLVVAGVVVLHVILLALVVPLSAPLAGFMCFASGTCAFAALCVRQIGPKLVIAAATNIIFDALCAQSSPTVALVFGSGLAMLTALFFAVGSAAGAAQASNLALQRTRPAPRLSGTIQGHLGGPVR